MQNNVLFSRQSYLDTLNKRIRDLKFGYRQNIAIIGDELVGKTSIIFKFLNGFSDNYVIPVYVEVRPETIESFSKRFIGVLLYNFLSNSGLPLKEDLDYLIKHSSKYIPQTVNKANHILLNLKKKKYSAFPELLGLCESIKQETGKSCVVIFDEFHNLETLGIKNLYQDWSNLLVTYKNTMYVIISSMKYRTKRILSKELSLLFGNFELINVEPFDVKTTEAYIESKLGGLDLKPGTEKLLVNFTAGYPFYLEVITNEIIKSPQAGLAETIESLLFAPSGILNQKFSNYLKRFMDCPNSPDYLAILYLISEGHNKMKDICQLMHKTKKEMTLRVNYLLELDAINRSADFLTISDRVFTFWLKFVYKNKYQALTFDAKNQVAIFKDKINEIINDFIRVSQKPVIERVTELLRGFEDDTMQIERKKLRLTRFREIKPLEFNGQSIKEGLIGRSGEGVWIMAFKHDLTTEDDVTYFAKECKKYHNKLQKKIIVTLKDIDSNARLRALEEKIWTL
ncbi:MAG: hypothetical protein NTY47_00855, partial [Candidatus Omnitrophica bacterium]|nr:hypothetical protein [Candidatus Omnitrophota bacterium]